MGPGGTVSAPGGRHVSAWWVNAIAAVLASSGWPWVYPGCRPPQPPAPSTLRSSERAAWLLSVRPSRSVVHFVVHQVGGWVGMQKDACKLHLWRRYGVLASVRFNSYLRYILLLYLHFTLYQEFCQISSAPKVEHKKLSSVTRTFPARFGPEIFA